MGKNSITLAAAIAFGFLVAYLIFDPNHSPEAHAGNDTETEILSQQVRVLCWVMTTPKNHESRAIHVKNTWGKRCNKLIFISSQSDEKLGAIGIPNTSDGRKWLWAKATGAFKYIWEHHRDEADWFMKADDDTYVILENLRNMLSHFNTKDPSVFGCVFKPPTKQKYMSGGAGYVLSKEALRRLVEEALPDKNKCKQVREEGEDVEISQCLEAVGVVAVDTTDTLGRHSFLPFSPEDRGFSEINGKDFRDSWFYYPQKGGMDCCSDMVVSFHYITPSQMYALEYLLYQVRVYGVSRNE